MSLSVLPIPGSVGISGVDIWAADRLRKLSGGDSADANLEEIIHIMQHLLNGKMEPANAAASIQSPSLANLPSHYFWVWVELGDSIRILGGDALVLERSVAFLNELHKSLGTLPGFGLNIYEHCLDFTLGDDDIHPRWDSSAWTASATSLLNVQSFAATYFVHGNIQDFQNMMLEEADFVFINSLEVATDTAQRLRGLRNFIPPAIRWMHIAGPQIFSICKEGSYKPTGRELRGLFDSDNVWLWEVQSHVFSMQRWTFWRERMVVIARDVELPPDYKAALELTVAKMDSISAW